MGLGVTIKVNLHLVKRIFILIGLDYWWLRKKNYMGRSCTLALLHSTTPSLWSYDRMVLYKFDYYYYYYYPECRRWFTAPAKTTMIAMKDYVDNTLLRVIYNRYEIRKRKSLTHVERYTRSLAAKTLQWKTLKPVTENSRRTYSAMHLCWPSSADIKTMEVSYKRPKLLNRPELFGGLFPWVFNAVRTLCHHLRDAPSNPQRLQHVDETVQQCYFLILIVAGCRQSCRGRRRRFAASRQRLPVSPGPLPSPLWVHDVR